MIGLVFADEGEAKTLAKKVGTAQKGGSSKYNVLMQETAYL